MNRRNAIQSVLAAFAAFPWFGLRVARGESKQEERNQGGGKHICQTKKIVKWCGCSCGPAPDCLYRTELCEGHAYIQLESTASRDRRDASWFENKTTRHLATTRHHTPEEIQFLQHCEWIAPGSVCRGGLAIEATSLPRRKALSQAKALAARQNFMRILNAGSGRKS